MNKQLKLQIAGRKLRLLLAFLGLMISIALVYISCNKKDTSNITSIDKNLSSVEYKFFNENRTSDPTEKQIVDFLKRVNAQKHFVEQTVSQIGYPRWDKLIKHAVKSIPRENLSSMSTKGNMTADVNLSDTYYVPFVRDSQNYVNASMILNASSVDTSINYICDWQYRDKVHGSVSVDTTAERHALFFMFLDNWTLGHTEFEITDNSLFSNFASPEGKKIIGLANSAANKVAEKKSSFFYDPTSDICIDTYVCGTPGYCADHGGCDYLNCVSSSDPKPCRTISSVCSNQYGSDGSGSGSAIASGGITVGGTTGGSTGLSGSGGGSSSGGSSGSGSGSGSATPTTPCNGTNAGVASTQPTQKGISTFQMACSSTSGWTPTVSSTNNKTVMRIGGNQIFFDAANSTSTVDINKMLKCFDNIPNAGATFSVKLCVDIPVDSDPTQLWNFSLKAGHAFLTLTKTNGSQTISQSFGFYPTSPLSAITFNGVSSSIVNDGEGKNQHEYNASIIMPNISSSNFQTLISTIKSISSNSYKLNDYNCAHFALNAINSIRTAPINSTPQLVKITNPSTLAASYVLFSQSPVGLYQTLSQMKSSGGGDAANIEIGVKKSATISNGECN